MTTTILLTCKAGYEKTLAREISLYDVHLQTKGSGWILAQWGERTLSKQHDTPLTDPCFAYHILKNPITIRATSVNDFTEKLINLFLTHISQKRITQPWAHSFLSSGNEQLIKRANTIKKQWFNKMLKKMSRVAKLAEEGIPSSSKFTDGFFVHLADFKQAFVSFKALSAGQQRMRMDSHAPARSYLKIEEAFLILGHEPRKNETVVDLGAAPGGWSYSALKRGASVTAIDNGPLKGPVKSSQNISHLKVDAITYCQGRSNPADWLFCDILDKPEVTLNLLKKWLRQKWCRYFIASIKVGRNDPIQLLRMIRDHQKGLLPYCKYLHIRQLYHDREEITLMGKVDGCK